MGERYPAAVTVDRKTGEISIHWEEGTKEDFLRVVRNLVCIGEAVLEMQERQKNAPEAGGAAPSAGESIDPDSL